MSGVSWCAHQACPLPPTLPLARPATLGPPAPWPLLPTCPSQPWPRRSPSTYAPASPRPQQTCGSRQRASPQPCGPRCAASGRPSRPAGSSPGHWPGLRSTCPGCGLRAALAQQGPVPGRGSPPRGSRFHSLKRARHRFPWGPRLAEGGRRRSYLLWLRAWASACCGP